MKIASDSIKGGVYEAFADWMLNHEISFPALLEQAVGDAVAAAFEAWLEKHSTQIIAQIAQSHASLSPKSACQH
jgi:hypothetical protein